MVKQDLSSCELHIDTGKVKLVYADGRIFR